jgi:predicted HTH domain antitoxin
MTAKTLTIPNSINLPPVFDLPVYIAAKLYADSVLSAGQAAELAQISKRTFLELLGRHGVSVFSEETTDLLEDIRNA